MASVSRAYGILAGRMTGDRKKAKEYLDTLSPYKYAMKNRAESSMRARMKKKRLKFGQRPTPRRAV